MTISNEGPRDVAFIGVELWDFTYPKDGGAWSTCARTTVDIDCLLPGLASGDQRTVTLGFAMPEVGLPERGTVQVNQYDADHLVWPDISPENNFAGFQVG